MIKTDVSQWNKNAFFYWFVIVSCKNKHSSPIHKQMNLVSRFFLGNQKNKTLLFNSGLQINDSIKPVLFSAIKNMQCDQ